VNTLDVIARHPECFRVFALSAATQVDLMLAQCQAHRPTYAVMASEPHARQLAERVKNLALPVTVLAGARALCEVSADADVRDRGRSGS
jgi:1-deoxy-D-xylulose-5-phosphate reductoisomerase